VTRPKTKTRGATAAAEDAYPSLAGYALIGDCHSAALISRSGSIDWCCLPRFDSDSCFGRLLDWNRGGHFIIAPLQHRGSRREYVGSSLVLASTFDCDDGVIRLLDFFAMRQGGREHPRRELVRIIEGKHGHCRVRVHICPRLDYGEVKPWIYRSSDTAYMAVGSNTGLLISGDVALQLHGDHDLYAEIDVRAGTRSHVVMQFVAPENMDDAPAQARDRSSIQSHLDETLAWWDQWAAKLRGPHGRPGASVVRSAITLKALTFAPTGAIIAAPTTSLPEDAGGERNWDYRFSWIRDSVFTAGALTSLGCEPEADGFRRFIQRSAAGNADELQVMYAVDGKRRLTEVELRNLDGWRGSRPVRIGNAASTQYQADMYGLLLELSWRWSTRGNVPSHDEWDFLVEIVNTAIAHWEAPDQGIWEIRDDPRHFVHSKVMCWAAVHRGLCLAETHRLHAPFEQWLHAREAIRAAVEADGIDRERGIFVAAFGWREVDAALLLLPQVGFIDYGDPLMRRTALTIRHELDDHGLIRRYRAPDGLRGGEGVFLPCSFWLAECLARQGDLSTAQELYEHACACANDLGLFSEEFVPASKEMLGNFPQGLTHLSHIAAALAIDALTPAKAAALA